MLIYEILYHYTMTTVEHIIHLCTQGATSYRCQNSTSVIKIGEERSDESSTLTGNNIVYLHAKIFAMFREHLSNICCRDPI